MKYELIIWDYDPEDGYFVAKRGFYTDRKLEAINAARVAADEYGHYVGAAVFLDGKVVQGYGFVMLHPDHENATAI